MLPARRNPRHETDQPDDANCCARVIHVAAVDGVQGREIERYACEEEEEEADDIHEDAVAAEGVGPVEDFGVACQAGEDAAEERHGVGEVEAFGGDGDDGVEPRQGAEVDAVEGELDAAGEEDGVDGDLAFGFDGGEEAGEGQAVVAGEGVEGAGSLCYEGVGADEDDHDDEGGEEAGSHYRVGGVVEDLDEGHACGRGGRGGDVSDAEADGD